MPVGSNLGLFCCPGLCSSVGSCAAGSAFLALADWRLPTETVRRSGAALQPDVVFVVNVGFGVVDLLTHGVPLHRLAVGKCTCKEGRSAQRPRSGARKYGHGLLWRCTKQNRSLVRSGLAASPLAGSVCTTNH